MADDIFSASQIKQTIMKKLGNTSPFLLLLLPVFMMIILTLTVSSSQNDADIVVKPAKNTNTIVTKATAIFK